MKIKIFLFILFISNIAFSQNLQCEDFKEGKFYIPMNGKADTLYMFNQKNIITKKIEIPVDKSLKNIL